jgi:hypothetical protein
MGSRKFHSLLETDTIRLHHLVHNFSSALPYLVKATTRLERIIS